MKLLVLRRGPLDNGYTELPITSQHAVNIDSLPDLHKDPFAAIEVHTEVADLPDSASRAFTLSVPITYAGVAGITTIGLGAGMRARSPRSCGIGCVTIGASSRLDTWRARATAPCGQP